MGNQTVDWPRWLPYGRKNNWLPAFFKISSFVFNREKKYRFGTNRGWV